jgi:hypothetical protein
MRLMVQQEVLRGTVQSLPCCASSMLATREMLKQVTVSEQACVACQMYGGCTRCFRVKSHALQFTCAMWT